MYQKKFQYDDAMINHNKCLAIQTKIKGEDSIDVAMTLNDIGKVYKSKGEHDKAL